MGAPAYISEVFAEGLNEKFKSDVEYSPTIFTVDGGRKYDRIVQTSPNGSGGHVHAFVERATGAVFKSAGWASPAQGARYPTIGEALAAADLHGGYLYKR